MDNLQSCLNWFDRFTGNVYQIKTVDNHEFSFIFERTQIPHLMGLQYAYQNQRDIGGSNIIHEVNQGILNESNIFERIKLYHPSMFDKVKYRIEHIQDFFECLEDAFIAQRTNEKTRIQSTYLVIKHHKGGYLELGLKPISSTLFVPETFIRETSDRMFSETEFKSYVSCIEVYDPEKAAFIKTSFNEAMREEIEQERYLEQHPELRKDPRLIDLEYECSEYRGSEHSTYERSIDDDFCR